MTARAVASGKAGPAFGFRILVDVRVRIKGEDKEIRNVPIPAHPWSDEAIARLNSELDELLDLDQLRYWTTDSEESTECIK